MAGFRIEGNTSGNVAEVTANNEIKVALGKTSATMGGAIIFSENDPGDIIGTPYIKSPETSSDYRLRMAPDYRDWETDRKSTRLNSSHITRSRMPSSA